MKWAEAKEEQESERIVTRVETNERIMLDVYEEWESKQCAFDILLSRVEWSSYEVSKNEEIDSRVKDDEEFQWLYMMFCVTDMMQSMRRKWKRRERMKIEGERGKL